MRILFTGQHKAQVISYCGRATVLQYELRMQVRISLHFAYTAHYA